MTWEPPPVHPSWDKKPGPDGKVELNLTRKTAKLIDRHRRAGETDEQVIDRALKINSADMAARRESPLSAARFPFHRPDVVRASVEVNRILHDLKPEGREKVLTALREKFPEIARDQTVFDAMKAAVGQFDGAQQLRFLETIKSASSDQDMIDGTNALLRERVGELELKLKPQYDELELLQRRRDGLGRLIEIAKDPRLEKLGETGFHKLLDAFRRRDILMPHKQELFPPHLTECLNSNSPVFVVQHNWAAAFNKAQDFAGGEWRLPYDETIFEFRISGARVIVAVSVHENGTPASAIMCVDTAPGWMLASVYTLTDGTWRSTKDHHEADPIFDLCIGQVRAIAIALEAEVAVTEVVRAPHKLNAKRERAGKLPILDYHVVNLSRRTRPERLPPAEGERGTHASPRLHFRRGHWRHFETHKTWIKWMLVGDPELGFVDKHYRL